MDYTQIALEAEMWIRKLLTLSMSYYIHIATHLTAQSYGSQSVSYDCMIEWYSSSGIKYVFIRFLLFLKDEMTKLN